MFLSNFYCREIHSIYYHHAYLNDSVDLLRNRWFIKNTDISLLIFLQERGGGGGGGRAIPLVTKFKKRLVTALYRANLKLL